MYFWKCWRDSRWRFFELVLLVLVVGMLFAWSASMDLAQKLARASVPVPTPDMLREVWFDTLRMAFVVGVLLAGVFGAVLGAAGLGEELERGSAPFLLSRPRPRRYFVWASNAFGAVELLAFQCLYALSIFAALAWFCKGVGTWRLFGMIPVLWVTSMLAHGLAQLLATAGRSVKNAFAGALVLLMFYGLVFTILKVQWRIAIPFPTDMLVLNPEPGTILIGTTLAWLAVAIGFTVVQQLVADRMEP